jgi:hypothetical protein
LVPVGEERIQGKGVGGWTWGNIMYSCMTTDKWDLLTLF